MIKYVACVSENTIKEVKIIRTSCGRFYFFNEPEKDFSTEEWIPIINDYTNDWTHHDTWEAARDYLKKRYDEEWRKHMSDATRITHKINQLSSMKNPFTKSIYISNSGNNTIISTPVSKETDEFYYCVCEGIELVIEKHPQNNNQIRAFLTFEDAKQYLHDLKYYEFLEIDRKRNHIMVELEKINNLKENDENSDCQ